MDSSGAVLRAVNLSRSFVSEAETVEAVKGVSLTASAGQFICVYGASGSGKSTLLNLLGGLDVPDEGVVEFKSVPFSSQSSDERSKLRLEHIAVVFQDNNLIGEFTAAENVALPLEVAGMKGSSARSEAVKALGDVGIETLKDRFPAQMSGGQRQRVGIARALVGGRSVLLADEPSGALDSQNSRDLFQVMRTLCDETGLVAIVSTHDPICREYADSVLEITDGVLAEKSAIG